MFQLLTKNPAGLVGAMASELARRNQAADADDIDQILTVIGAAAATAAYATKAKSLLVRPLRKRGIAFDASDWRSCAILLYALWLGIGREEAVRRMAALAKEGDKWRESVPDEDEVDEGRLMDFYTSLGPFEGCGVHDYNDLSLALRYYVAEVLAPISAGRGVFDLGGGDGISCTCLREVGATGVTLVEPNPAARDFSRWLNGELGFGDVVYLDAPPTEKAPLPGVPWRGRSRFGAGLSTEVLEHVIDPPAMLCVCFDMLDPGGVMFVTSSFGIPGPQHLKSNARFAGHEAELMRSVGFVPFTAPKPPPIPFLPSWGFWRRP